MRVLLLEDDLQLGKALAMALVQEGFAPQWLRRLQEALTLLEHETFAIALIDIGLPDGSGLELLGWLRERVHVHHLRRKLGGSLIRTVRGIGHVLEQQQVS